MFVEPASVNRRQNAPFAKKISVSRSFVFLVAGTRFAGNAMVWGFLVVIKSQNAQNAVKLLLLYRH